MNSNEYQNLDSQNMNFNQFTENPKFHRPTSNLAQPTVPAQTYSIPPRAASETHTLINQNLNSKLEHQSKSHLNPSIVPTTLTSGQGTNDPKNLKNLAKETDEHKLIAKYSKELRQKSEPELVSLFRQIYLNIFNFHLDIW